MSHLVADKRGKSLIYSFNSKTSAHLSFFGFYDVFRLHIDWFHSVSHFHFWSGWQKTKCCLQPLLLLILKIFQNNAISFNIFYFYVKFQVQICYIDKFIREKPVIWIFFIPKNVTQFLTMFCKQATFSDFPRIFKRRKVNATHYCNFFLFIN